MTRQLSFLTSEPDDRSDTLKPKSPRHSKSNPASPDGATRSSRSAKGSEQSPSIECLPLLELEKQLVTAQRSKILDQVLDQVTEQIEAEGTGQIQAKRTDNSTGTDSDKRSDRLFHDSSGDRHPLPNGSVLTSPGAHFTYQVIGPCCRLFDREELPWPCCRLQWRGKEPSWRRIGRRFVPDMAVKNAPSYGVEILEPGYMGDFFVLTLYSVKLSPEQREWWYSRRMSNQKADPAHNNLPDLPDNSA